MRRKVTNVLRRLIVSVLLVTFLSTSVAETGIGKLVVEAKNTDSWKNTKLVLDGNNSAVIKKDGSLWIWGENYMNILGVKNTSKIRTPIEIMDNVVDIDLSFRNVIAAVKEDRSLWMRGRSSYHIGNDVIDTEGASIKIMDGVVDVELGEYATAVIKEDGSLWMWGWETIFGLSTTPEKYMENVIDVSLGNHSYAAIKNDGSLWMWGNNSNGQIGNGTKEDQDTPIKIMEDVVDVIIEYNSTLAIKEDGSLWMWGTNSSTIIGEKYDQTRPVKVMDDVVNVEKNHSKCSAIKKDGSLWVWGSGNEYGVELTTTPIKIMENAAYVSTGEAHNGVVKEDGSLWMWGDNYYGQIGSGSEVYNQETPIQIMPAGSIEVSGSENEEGNEIDELPISVEKLEKPKIKVVDQEGKPIAGAEVNYNASTSTTDENGTVILSNYVNGKTLEISKAGFNTKSISQYIRNENGSDCIVLSLEGKPLQEIYAIFDDETCDLSKQEIIINRYDTKEKFTIECKGSNEIASYELYVTEKFSGTRKVASSKDGVFKDLKSREFLLDAKFLLKIFSEEGKLLEEKVLPIEVVSIDTSKFSFTFGGAHELVIPSNIPIIGSMKLKLSMIQNKLPYDVTISRNGTFKVGINTLNIKKFYADDYWRTIEGINKDNAAKFLEMLDSDLESMPSASGLNTISFSPKIMGYLEGKIEINEDKTIGLGPLTGRLVVGVTVSKYWEQQILPMGVPIVIEYSISGKMNADGSISYTLSEGLNGGKVNLVGEVGLGAYGGLGVAYAFSGGIYGSGALGWTTPILPEWKSGFYDVYLKGNIGVKGKFLGKNVGDLALLEGTYYIPTNYATTSTYAATAPQLMNLAIENHKVYEDIERNYLSANGGEKMQWSSYGASQLDGNVQEMPLQEEAYLDIIPKVVKTDGGAILFCLTDGGSDRSSEDRSQLVYSVYQEDGSWSETKAIDDNNTADFAPDIYVENGKVYVVWQDARESLKGNLTLDEIASTLDLHVAVYDEETKEVKDLGIIERVTNDENGHSLQPQRPQIAVEDGSIQVYWYENATDNVLGLTGTNQMYMATLEESEPVIQIVELYSEEDNLDSEADTKVSEDIQDESTGEEPKATETSEDEKKESVSDNQIEGMSETISYMDDTDSVTENTISENDISEENEDEIQEEPVTEEEIVEEENVETKEIMEEVAQNSNLMTSELLQEAQWLVSLIGEETQCINSADAGTINGALTYAYSAGKLNDSYEVTEGSVVSYTKENGFKTVETGKPEHVEISEVFSEATLSWYQGGDIRYIDKEGNVNAFFGEGRLNNSVYTLIADGDGSPEIIFPLNMDGKSNLYRITYEDGIFTPALAITDQKDYIQYVDGFVHEDKTVFVYNQMEVNENLEEVNNRLLTGILSHSYQDLIMRDAGSMVLSDDEHEDYLEISANVYNNGTVKAENLKLRLMNAEGEVLEESLETDLVLESGEDGYVSARFSLNNITVEDDYIVSVVGGKENNVDNNQKTLHLGGTDLWVATNVISVGDTRTLQVGIKNNGITACGGKINLYDAESGAECCSSIFEAVIRGETAYVEIEISPETFQNRDSIAFEVEVVPEPEGDWEKDVEILSQQLVVFAPTYSVSFINKESVETVYATYGETIVFPQNPMEERKRFKGWYTSENPQEGSLYTEETKITENVTLYACFAEENESISLEECSVSAITDQMYTGGALKPVVTVKWGSTILNPKTDYMVGYTDNKEQGTATVTITGKGKYTGSITRKFNIYYSIEKVGVASISKVKFDGNYHTPEVTVNYQRNTLEEGKDYIVTYSNNRNAGTAAVIITGKGKYKGSKTVNFTIEGISISGMKFDKLENAIYSGKEEKATVVVKTKEGKLLRNGADYKLVYENTINKGTASVTVVGNGNFSGSKKLTYKILSKTMTDDMVEEITPITFTGANIKPEIAVADGDTTLVLGKDYKVSYSSNKKAGTGYVTITGAGNYAGKVKIPFTIEKANLQDNAMTKVVVDDVAYTGKACKPSVQVYYGDKKLGGNDYTVSYTNNVAIGNAFVTVIGKGNYEGTVSKEFRIVEKKRLLSSLKVEKLENDVYTGNAIEPSIIITDGDYTLQKGKDYNVVYNNQYQVGTASAIITGIGNYAGSKTLTYKITKRSFGKNNVWADGFEISPPEEQLYTGNALKPDVLLKDNGTTLILGKDYTLSYSANTKLGTAKITVKGKGNYAGSVGNITFIIKEWEYDGLQAYVENQMYTGKALKPQVTFQLGEEEISLKTGTAVKITYSNNKDAGTSKVTITGVGVLKNMKTIEISFKITPADLEGAVVGRIANQKFKGVALKPVPNVKVGKNTLKVGRDFEVSYIRNKVKGEAEVIITGVGNYKGECRKTFIIE